jgi:TM2 domain-containing membrane protein YozV
MNKKTYTLLLILSCTVLETNAAFPINNTQSAVYTYYLQTKQANIISLKTRQSTSRSIEANNVKPAKPRGKNKKKWVAILLGVLLGAYGIHRFYLGYTWQGIIQALAYPLLYTGILLLAFPPAGIALASVYAYAAVCLTGAAAIWIWRWVDIIRIATGSLEPANGSGYTD